MKAHLSKVKLFGWLPSLSSCLLSVTWLIPPRVLLCTCLEALLAVIPDVAIPSAPWPKCICVSTANKRHTSTAAMKPWLPQHIPSSQAPQARKTAQGLQGLSLHTGTLHQIRSTEQQREWLLSSSGCGPMPLPTQTPTTKRIVADCDTWSSQYWEEMMGGRGEVGE